MSRDFHIPGEAMVYVKGRAGTGIANRQELGLCLNEITCSPVFYREPITLDAWGNMAPIDMQVFLAAVNISIQLINFDRDILDLCMQESLGGASAIGKVARAGTRLGKGQPLYSNTNNFITLGITSPIDGKPWRFFACCLDQNPAVFPMGTKKQVVQCNWTAIPYATDPWNGGTGAQDVTIWDHVDLT